VTKLCLEQFFPYCSVSLAERISASLSKIYAKQFGIGNAEWRVLATLGEFAQLQARDIVGHTNMDKVRVSRAVKLLRDKGFVAAQVLADDHRGARLTLTDSGSELYHRIVPDALAWEQSLLEPLSKQERKALEAIYAKLGRRLSEQTEA